MLIKKGAMFGLDARIALAIFGALSLISGAALYSAIQEAKVVAMVTDMQEFAKAREHYLLDTGQDLPLQGSRNLRTAELVQNDANVANWNGPYYPYEVGTTDSNYLDHPKYDLQMFVTATKIPAWNVPTDPTPLCSANPSESCFVWVHITGVTEDLNKMIDQYIDGEINGQEGNYRWRTNATYLNVGLKTF